jgi:membrane-bound ClpP family serine protease
MLAISLIVLLVYLLAGVMALAILSRWEPILWPEDLQLLDGWAVSQLMAWPVLLLVWLVWGRTTIPASAPKAESMIGQVGKSVSDLRPWGKVEIAGQLWEANAIRGFVCAGQPVHVISQESTGLIVRLSAPDELSPDF